MVIGEGLTTVRVVVQDVGYGYVKLGFDAPRSVKIDRAEVREQITSNGGRRDAQVKLEDEIGPTV